MWAIKCWYERSIWVFEKYTSQEVAEEQLKDYRKKNKDFYKAFWVEKYTSLSKRQQLLEDLHIHKRCLVCTSVRLRMISDRAYEEMSKPFDDEEEIILSIIITKAIERAIQALGISITEEEKEALKYHIIRGD